MRTLSEIQRTEDAQRERAEQYEKLLGEQARLRTVIGRLSPKQMNVKALEQIYELAGQVPASLITRGSRLTAGGFVVRDLLIQISANALQDAQRMAQEIDAELAKAKSDLERVEAALAEFK